jgi:hypothetical protein
MLKIIDAKFKEFDGNNKDKLVIIFVDYLVGKDKKTMIFLGKKEKIIKKSLIYMQGNKFDKENRPAISKKRQTIGNITAKQGLAV